MLVRLRSCLPHVVMLLVAVALYAAASRIESPPGRIGPDFWPKVVISLMGLLCLYEIVKRLLFAGGAATPGPIEEPAGAPALAAAPALAPAGEEPLQVGVLLGGGALIAGYVVGVSWLGFFLSTLLFLCSFAWVGGFRRPLWVLLIGLGGSLLTLLLFMRVAYISLPLGEGPFRVFSLALLRLIGVS
jgi:hypothetical protein